MGFVGGTVVALHLLACAPLVAFVVQKQLEVQDRALGLGVGLAAYLLGLRRAYESDHVAAIDSGTRRLTGERSRPLGVGLTFSLGHSTLVFVLALLLSIGLHTIADPIDTDVPSLHSFTGLLGTTFSAMLLYVVASVNIVVLFGIVRMSSRRHPGASEERKMERYPGDTRFVDGFIRRAVGTINRPWHMYPLGIVFGLGFVTALETIVLALAGIGAIAGLPWHAILCLPALFAAGMSLPDTIGGLT